MKYLPLPKFFFIISDSLFVYKGFLSSYFSIIFIYYKDQIVNNLINLKKINSYNNLIKFSFFFNFKSKIKKK